MSVPVLSGAQGISRGSHSGDVDGLLSGPRCVAQSLPDLPQRLFVCRDVGTEHLRVGFHDVVRGLTDKATGAEEQIIGIGVWQRGGP